GPEGVQPAPLAHGSHGRPARSLRRRDDAARGVVDAASRRESTPKFTTPQLPINAQRPKFPSSKSLGSFGGWRLGVDWALRSCDVGDLSEVSAFRLCSQSVAR